MQGEDVANLHHGLVSLHISLDAVEVESSTFGSTTYEAIKIFQASYHLDVTGEVDEPTASKLNEVLRDVKQAEEEHAEHAEHDHEHREEDEEEEHKERDHEHREEDEDEDEDDEDKKGHPPTHYTVTGTVRDANGQTLAGITVLAFTKTLLHESLLASGTTLQDGSYTISYRPPVNKKEQNVHFNLVVKALDAQGQIWIVSPTIFRAQQHEQVDLMVGGTVYAGSSIFETVMTAIQPSLDGLPVGQLVETDEHQNITFVANDSQQDPELVMRLVVSFRLQELADLQPEVFFAFIQQGLPTTLPRSLLVASDHFKQIDLLLHNALSGIASLDPAIQKSALEQAIAKNIIPLKIKADLDQILQKLQTLQVSDILQQPYLAGKVSLQTMLSLSTLPQTLYTTFAQLYLNHQGTSHDFWQTLGQQQGFTTDIIADLRLTLGVGTLVKNHTPVVTYIKQGFQQGTYSRVQDLAKLDITDWQNLIQQSGNDQVKGYPGNIAGKTEADKISTFANEIYARVEHAFPTTSLVANVSRVETPLVQFKPQVMQFFNNNPILNLSNIHIDRYLKDTGEQALQGIPEELRPQVIQQVKAMQRVQRLAPSTNSATALLAQKIHSSQQIYFASQQYFISDMVANGATTTEARRVYQRAAQSYALVVSRIAQYNAQFNRATPAAMISPILTNDLTEQLQDYPTLRTLFGSLDYCSCAECASVLGAAAYLVDILLFLKGRHTNSGTTLRDTILARRPDLGSILLNCQNTNTPLPYIDLVCEVLEEKIAPTGQARQTTWSADELRASPEYVNTSAYNTLKSALYPITLPFNLPLTEARVYLNHLGVQRYQLMQTFQKRPVTAAQQQDIAAEYSGISPEEEAIIVTADSAHQTTYWNETDPVTALSIVATFLQKSQLSYDQLIELLTASFIQSGGDPSVIESLNDACDTQQQQITNLSLARLDAIHRFLRLWRHTQWRIWELDSVLSNPHLGNGILDEPTQTLVLLMGFNVLQNQLSLGVEQLLGFYDALNTASRDLPDGHEDALYQKLFLNSTVIDTSDTSPASPATVFSVASVTQASPTALLENYLPTLQAALATREADIRLLLPKTNGTISLANLSLLYRYTTLARGMSLSMSDLLLFLSVVDIADPFADVQTTQNTLDTSALLRSSGFTLAQLAYLLTYAPDSPVGISSDVIVSDIGQLSTALQKAIASTTSQDVKAQRESTVKQIVSSLFQLSNQQANTLLTSFMVPGTAITLLQALNDDYLLQHTPQTIADAEANVPNACAALRLLHKIALLLRQLSISADDLQWLIANVGAYGGFDMSQLPVQSGQLAISFAVFIHLVQVVQFKKQYPAPTPDIGSFFDVLAAVQAAIQAHTDQTAVLDALSKLTTWDRGELGIVDSALNLQITDYEQIATYENLAACFALLQRLAAKAKLVSTWAQEEPTTDDAAQIKQTAKSKYDNAHWLTVAPPLQDVIREQKRAALVAYMVAHPELDTRQTKWADDNGLFSFFLIDVDMTACQLTSRIVQATNSVQLFVQRCLMNLEEDITVDSSADPDWLQWQWMKEYRLWEANRQVFLYPENWILPELRKDKSPFFQDLEHDLLQNEITNDNVETALLTYLHKVNDVAHVEVCGMYHDDETGILHVFARTHGTPPVYYYRYLEDGEWSAWEKVPLDIKSNQVVPVVYNRKLYLFWAIFTEKSEGHNNQQLPPAQASQNPPPPPNSYWEIQLAWSYHRDGKWVAQTISKLKLIQPQKLNVLFGIPGFDLSFFGLPDFGQLGFFVSLAGPPIRPEYAYNFKAMMRDLDLVINVFASPSIEFDGSAYNEAASPYQVAEFVFNGDVTGVNVTDPFTYYWVQQNYGADGRAIGLAASPQSPLLLPYLSHFDYEDLTNTSNNVSVSNNTSSGQMYVLKQSSLRVDNGKLLATALVPFEVLVPHQDAQFDSTRPFFYQDKQRAYFIVPTILYQNGSVFTPNPPPSLYNATYEVSYLFKEFYHPYITLFIRELDRLGVKGLYNRQLQVDPGSVPPGNSFSFSAEYTPTTSLVTADYDQEVVDFADDGAYAIYNWELFFHAPLMIAMRLTQNQRFEEAMQWFHYIFDPTNPVNDDVPRRFWITKKFYELSASDVLQQDINNLLKLVNQRDADAEHQVAIWHKYPFDPHRIARLRPVAYEKTVVMKYLDMLIAWGDNLFRQETIESVNLATQLYIRAAEILGPRPQEIPALQPAQELSFYDFEKLNPDDFSNVVVEVENTIALSSDGSGVSDPNTPKLPRLHSFYFCVPANDQLLTYWDTVADRLFKIRHCQNIEGQAQQLPLFAPPINPALLVQATAAGVDLGSILNDLTAQLPFYRFRYMLQRAYDFCREVQTLGQKLLTALERSDAEALALLRSSQEIIVQQAIEQIRQQQITEANQLVDVLMQAQLMVQIRQQYYGSRPFMNGFETAAVVISGTASVILLTLSGVLDLIASGLQLIPSVNVGISGFGGTPKITTTIVGPHIGSAVDEIAKGLQTTAAISEIAARISSTLGQYQRRMDEWNFQKQLADQDLVHVLSQITAAQLHLAIVTQQAQLQGTIVSNVQAVDDFLHNKFTNEDLYNWMVDQISTIYFQAYQLAYAMAKNAELCFRHELGLQTSSYIQFGYWDSLKKGLLAGDKLFYDLHRMESDFIAQNKRELEITRVTSLAQVAPASLTQLRVSGTCTFDLPELLFDMDYPGHYMRRIKMVRLIVNAPKLPPNVNCTLTLTKNSIRFSTDVSGGYPRSGTDPNRFVDDLLPQEIVTSTAQASSVPGDNGLFTDTELYKIEVRDDRYTPFELAGAISSWQLDIPQETNAFDISTITDVTLSLTYTARDGIDKNVVMAAIKQALSTAGFALTINVASAFPDAWKAFLTPPVAGNDQTLTLPIMQAFPFSLRKYNITVTQIDLIAQFEQATNLVAQLTTPATGMQQVTLTQDGVFGTLQHIELSSLSIPIGAADQWQLKLRTQAATNFTSLPPNLLEDVYIVLFFQAS